MSVAWFTRRPPANRPCRAGMLACRCAARATSTGTNCVSSPSSGARRGCHRTRPSIGCGLNCVVWPSEVMPSGSGGLLGTECDLHLPGGLGRGFHRERGLRTRGVGADGRDQAIPAVDQPAIHLGDHVAKLDAGTGGGITPPTQFGARRTSATAQQFPVGSIVRVLGTINGITVTATRIAAATSSNPMRPH